uniref:Galectin n=2 Tax=Meloidogyne TaxID=189290 RepID=A0A6V7WBV3_MELEN|nr:unnamed protein product [Meloidogyne enterolobii]
MYQTANVPLHFTPRFHFNPPRIVRNNWSKDKGWGPEDTSGVFPFKAGQPFILEFVAESNNTIIININNKRFATFSRVDLSKISQLFIDGINSILVNILTLCPNQEIKKCCNKKHCQFCNQSQICDINSYPNPCV